MKKINKSIKSYSTSNQMDSDTIPAMLNNYKFTGWDVRKTHQLNKEEY